MYVFYVHQVFMEATGIEFTGTGVINSCELPGVGAGNWIWILYKSSKCF